MSEQTEIAQEVQSWLSRASEIRARLEAERDELSKRLQKCNELLDQVNRQVTPVPVTPAPVMPAPVAPPPALRQRVRAPVQVDPKTARWPDLICALVSRYPGGATAADVVRDSAIDLRDTERQLSRATIHTTLHRLCQQQRIRYHGKGRTRRYFFKGGAE